MVSITRLWYKVALACILVFTCRCHQTEVTFKIAESISVRFKMSVDVYENVIFMNGQLLCYGGHEIGNIFTHTLNCSLLEPKYGNIVESVAVHPSSEAIGAVTAGIFDNKSFELCDKKFKPFKKISLGEYIPRKLYYTPNGKYLVLLAVFSKDFYHKQPCIKIFDLNKSLNVPVASLPIKISKNIKTYGLPQDDYLLIPDDQHIVYVSCNKNADKTIFFKIFRLQSQSEQIIEKIKLFEPSENIYSVLAALLSKKPKTIPLYIDPANGYFFLYSSKEKTIKKYNVSSDECTAWIESSFPRFGAMPYVVYPHKYLALWSDFHQIELFDMDLKRFGGLVVNKKNDREICDVSFSDDGQKLIIVTTKKVLIVDIIGE